MNYYASKPASTDKAWCAEMSSVSEFCVGRGLDPGAGNRTFSDTIVRCDIRPEVQPDHVCDATALPFAEGMFDFVINSHLIEHLHDPRAALLEWLRVVKPGGYICCIIPNTEYTHGMNSDPTPHLHEWAPAEFAAEVLGWQSKAEPWFTAKGRLDWCDAELVLLDDACPQWSFCCVMRKGM